MLISLRGLKACTNVSMSEKVVSYVMCNCNFLIHTSDANIKSSFVDQQCNILWANSYVKGNYSVMVLWLDMHPVMLTWIKVPFHYLHFVTAVKIYPSISPDLLPTINPITSIRHSYVGCQRIIKYFYFL